MNGETSSLCKPFKLPALGFKVAEMIGVPGGGVGVGDRFGFYGGELVKAGGECVVIAVNQFSGGRVLGGRVIGDGVRQ